MIAWLIEYFPVEDDNAKQPLWWNGTLWNGHDDSAWTNDANNAIKFVSQTSAFVVAHALMRFTDKEDRKIGRHRRKDWYGEFRATGHEFLDAAPSAGSAGQAAMSISKRDAWAESLKKGAHRCRQHGDNGDAETLDDVRNYLVANACAQAVDQQARRLALIPSELLRRMRAYLDRYQMLCDRGDVEGEEHDSGAQLIFDIEKHVRALAHPETPNKED